MFPTVKPIPNPDHNPNHATNTKSNVFVEKKWYIWITYQFETLRQEIQNGGNVSCVLA